MMNRMIAVLFALFVCGTTAFAEEPAPNHVANGDFLQGQYKWIPDIRDQALEADFSDGELKLKRLKEGYSRIYQDIAITPGTYEFSANLRMVTPKTVVHLWLIPRNSAGQFQEKSPIYLSAYYSDGKLKNFKRTVEIPADITGARLCIVVNGSQGEAVIDDIKLIPGAPDRTQN